MKIKQKVGLTHEEFKAWWEMKDAEFQQDMAKYQAREAEAKRTGKAMTTVPIMKQK